MPPGNTTVRNLLIAALFASVVLVCGVALFSHRAWSALLDAFTSVSHAREEEQQVVRLLSHLDDAETGQRGYLLTQKESYLEPYNASLPLISSDITRLRYLCRDNPVQQARIETLSHLIEVKMRLLDVKISFQKAGYHDRAIASMNNDDGKQAMDAIRKVIVTMEKEEGSILQEREARLTRRAFANKMNTVGIIGLYVFFIGLTAFLVWRLSRVTTLLSVCAWSKNVKYEGQWITFEKYLKLRFGINTTHGLSPVEAEKFLRDLDGETPQAENQAERAREILLDELCGFRQATSRDEIRTKYWNAPRDAYRGLDIHWDYRRNANRLNIEIPADDLNAAQLYECDTAFLLANLVGGWNLDFSHLFEEADENTLLRVVSHWDAGNCLTPPFLKMRADGKLVKRDGFHRLAVAIAAGAPRIPFWAVLDHCPPEIMRIPETENPRMERETEGADCKVSNEPDIEEAVTLPPPFRKLQFRACP